MSACLSVCLSVCPSVGQSVQIKICLNFLNVRNLGKCYFFYFFLKTPPLPLIKSCSSPPPTKMRNKQICNNFDRQEGGGGLCSLYLNYTPAPLRASFPINYIRTNTHVIIKLHWDFFTSLRKFLDIIACYISTWRWLSIYIIYLFVFYFGNEQCCHPNIHNANEINWQKNV